MSSHDIRFDDGAAYERYMGVWSQSAGRQFLDWLGLPAGRRWLDVGCGNGAFTELIVARCAPAAVAGIDPSEAQLAYAASRLSLRAADLRRGDAQALPFDDGTFDAAVMPLVIFFVPDPARGVAEMTRVVRGGGSVSAYAWDMPGGGFPYEPLFLEMRAAGLTVPAPPSPDASRLDALQRLWAGAGLGAIETTTVAVTRTFASADEYWTIVQGSSSVGPQLKTLSPGSAERLREAVVARLQPAFDGRLTCRAWAHAVRGVVTR